MLRLSPLKIQSNQLRRLLGRAAHTEWGKKFGFAHIAQQSDVVKAYQSCVPIHTYDDLKPSIDRIRAGEEDILWPGKIRHFAISSGTASEGKIIPVSHDMLLLTRKLPLWMTIDYLQATGSWSTFLGKHLILPGKIDYDPQYQDVLIGEVSGLLSLYSPYIYTKFFRAIPSSLMRISNWDSKLRAVVDVTMNQDIRVITMVPTWAPVFFRLLIQHYNKIHGVNICSVGEIWPNLKLYISAGVALSSYKSIIEEYIALPDLHFLEAYGASEGTFSYQTDLEDPAMQLLLNHGVFFEFIRMDDLATENPKRFTIEHVQTNVRYAPVLTTSSGLWSYLLGDVIRFTNLSPPKILVAGRTSEMMDVYGEAVFGEEARTAINKACRSTNSILQEYHVSAIGPSGDMPPTHEWIIEFNRVPQDCQAFLRMLDASICKINVHYQFRREGYAFRPPEMVIVPHGTFNAWLIASRGEINCQTKVPRMSDERDIANGILNQAGQSAQRIRIKEFQ